MINKFLYLLSKKDKRNFAFIFLIILGSAFLELIGVSAILPIVELLEKGNSVIESNSFLKLLNTLFNLNGDSIKLCLVSLGALSLFFIVKCAYTFFSVYIINRFEMSYCRKLTRRLMTTYLLFPYEFHLENNSSTLIRKSTYDVGHFMNGLTDFLTLIVKVLSSLAIIAFLFITDWKVALVLFILLGAFACVVLILIKPKSKKIGLELQKYNSQNYKYLSQAFNGIKESKISNSENYFVNEYDLNMGSINKLNIKRILVNAIPTQTIEVVGMVGLCLSLLLVLLLGVNTSDIVITFSVFAYATIKLIPSITSMATIINNLQFYMASINALYDDIKLTENVSYIEQESSNINDMSFNNQIELKNVVFYYKSYPDKKVINNISLNIKKNTSVAFCGASGAGKTTLIDIILGLLPCRDGNILCDGVNIQNNLRGWRSNISYIPQTIFLSDDTIRTNVAFGISKDKIDDDRIWDALEKAQLSEYVKSLPNGLDTIIGERGVRMSGGQRQRIGIARAFYRNTNIIVFDEATSALDYETEKNILDHVSKFSKSHTLIIITHRLNTIDSCDYIYKVENGLVNKIK